jgi:monothiol glutaredoxin
MTNVTAEATAIFAQIQKLIDENAIVLFMKGTKQFPMCGFSGFAVQALQQCNVDFVDINILEDPAMRQGIKEFTNWPTIPQLYVRGEFIGGADIVKEMLQSGELQALFQAA